MVRSMKAPRYTISHSVRSPRPSEAHNISVSTILAHPQPLSLPHIKYKILHKSYGRLGDKCQKSQDWTSCDVCTRTLPYAGRYAADCIARDIALRRKF